MMKIRFKLAFFAVSLFLCAASSPGQTKHPKYALLVGVTKYDDSNMNRNPLRFPEEDAKALKDLLERSGYHVDLLVGKSATRKAVLQALDAAQRQGKEDGAVLIGFFGHGAQYDKTAFFCPFDTSLRILKDTRGNVIRNKNGTPKQEPDPASLVSMRAMLDALSTCGATNRILLADCCRDDPNRPRGRTAFGSSLNTQDLPPGTAALFACQKGEQAYEHDDWRHGAFTYAFLKHAQELAAKGSVTSGTLSDKIYVTVREIVKEKTGKAQQSVYALNSGRVDFLLKPIGNKLAMGKDQDGKKVAPQGPPAKSGERMYEVFQIEHAGAGAELMEMPSLKAYMKVVLTVPRAAKGSEVIVEERSEDKSGQSLKWSRIRVLNGPAKGKTGWTLDRHLKVTGKKIRMKIDQGDRKGLIETDDASKRTSYRIDWGKVKTPMLPAGWTAPDDDTDSGQIVE